MKIIYILFFSVLLTLSYCLGATQFSQPACSGIENSDKFLVSEGVSCDTIQDFNNLYYSLTKISTLPEKTPRIFINKNSYSGWTTFGNLMYLDEDQLLFGKKRTLQMRQMIWLHELGHLVFQELLKKDFTEINQVVEYMKKDADLKWKNKNPDLNTDKELSKFWCANCGAARDIQKPYAELFADFISALATSDPATPFEAYHTNEMNKTDLQRFKLASFGEQSNLDSCSDTDEHFYFSSVRYRIGQKFIIQAKTFPQKKKAVLDFYEILQKDLIRYWQKDKKLPSCKLANQNLLEVLK